MTTILFWSLAFVTTRLALHHFSVYSLGFLRYLAASLTLLPVALATGIKPPRREDIKWFAAAGALGFFFYMIAFNKGCETVNVSTSSVIMATVPVMTALFARMVLGESLRGVQWLAIAIEFAGIVVLTMKDGVFTINSGILWLLLAAVSLCAYNLLQRFLTRSYSALQVTTYGIFAGTIMLAVFLPGSIEEARTASGTLLSYVVFLGVFPSAIAYITWAKAFMKAERTSYVTNYMFITPFLTTLQGFLIVGELPDSATVVGGAIILSGAFLFAFASGRPADAVE
ncbi:MAG: DMT family transporter [Synergistaceae bacterium]|nr:DMT family transporter [Synergistota bacterium]NLM72376.1 DMT family transporter [Synergistaceae bacterium]